MTLQEEVGQKMLAGTATEQEILEAEYDWFVKQGKPQCVDEEGLCVYRNGVGNGCAVGIFIPDSEESRQMIGDLEGLLGDGYVPEFEEYFDILNRLQITHDTLSGPSRDEFTEHMKTGLIGLGYKGE